MAEKEEIVQQDPSYPFVKFKKMKTFSTKEDIKGESRPTFTYLHLRGCHNKPENVMHWIKLGHVPVEYGNLKPKHGPVKEFLDTVLRRNVDPALINFGVSPMEKKIKEAK